MTPSTRSSAIQTAPSKSSTAAIACWSSSAPATRDSRRGKVSTARTGFPETSRELAKHGGGPFVIDGEVCVLDEMGRSDFERCRIALDAAATTLAATQ